MVLEITPPPSPQPPPPPPRPQFSPTESSEIILLNPFTQPLPLSSKIPYLTDLLGKDPALFLGIICTRVYMCGAV